MKKEEPIDPNITWAHAKKVKAAKKSPTPEEIIAMSEKNKADNDDYRFYCENVKGGVNPLGSGGMNYIIMYKGLKQQFKENAEEKEEEIKSLKDRLGESIAERVALLINNGLHYEAKMEISKLL